MTLAEILAYWDSTAWMDAAAPRGDRDHRDELLQALCLAAIDRDRNLIELVIAAGLARGRGGAIATACERHRTQAERARQLEEDDADA